MRYIGTLSIGSLALVLLGLQGVAHASQWDVDPAHSEVGFAVKHLMISDVHGNCKKFTGTVDLGDKDIEGGGLVVGNDVKLTLAVELSKKAPPAAEASR